MVSLAEAIDRLLWRIIRLWKDQKLSRDDPADQATRNLHDRCVMGCWQADDVALFPFPEQLDRWRKRGILGDVQTKLAYRRHSIRSDQDLGHAGPPPTELLGQRWVEVLTEQADVGKEQHHTGNCEDHRFDDPVRHTEALGESIVGDRLAPVRQVAERTALRLAVQRQ